MAAFFLAAPLIQAGGIATTAAAAAATAHPAVSHAPAIEKVQAAPELPRGASSLGALSSSATVNGMVVLKPPNSAALQAFINEVTNRQSAEYHEYLAPGQFASRFGASPATIDAVEHQLQADGLRVTGVSADGLFVNFSAPASRTEAAFHTSINRYRLSDGSIGQATTSAIQLPSAIAGSVSSVIGLNDLVRLQPAGIQRGSASASGSHPAAKAPAFTHAPGAPAACPDATTAAQQFGGLTDDQIANAYGATQQYEAGNLGGGQHVAVYELEPFDPADLQGFDTCYFGAAKAAQMAGTNGVAGGRLTINPVDGGQTAGPGSGEAILDVEDVSAIAPNANIDVFEAPNNTFGGIDEYQQMIDTAHPDPIITSSWGFCETAMQLGEPGLQQAENILFEQAAAQGQSVFSAAGDTGSNTCNAFRTPLPLTPILSADDPSSQPYVVAVGGTTIEDATQPPQETVWNDGPFGGAGGGGISASWPMPSWQTAATSSTTDHTTVNQANSFEATDLGQPGYEFCLSTQQQAAGTTACRQLPDVSAQADEFTGAVTIFSADLAGGWTTIGGTSSAAPIWAGLLALVNTSSTCKTDGLTSGAGVGGVGFVSPLLYAVASSPGGAASFHDITAGNNDPYSDSNLFPAEPGYDMASGLGTPQLTTSTGGPALAANLCNVARPTARSTVTSISPGFGPVAGGETVTITGSKPTGATVTGVEVGGFALPSSDFTAGGSGTSLTITATLPAASVLKPVTAPPNTVPDATDGAGRYQVLVTTTTGGVVATSAPTTNSYFEYVDESAPATRIPTVTSIRSYGGSEAGGNIVDIFGTGFTGVTGTAGVTFGGVNATGYTVLSDFEISATVPAFSTTNTNCARDGSTFGESATTDVCQVLVVVTGPNGSSSTTDTILPLYEGALTLDATDAPLGVQPLPPPPAPAQELAPQPDEYDYFPSPTITSVSSDGGPADFASEQGLTIVTLHGTGFNLAGLDWVDVGDPTMAVSQNFFNIVNITGTEIDLTAPPQFNPEDGSLTSMPLQVPVAVQTIAGLSAPGPEITYAGVPTVTGVVATGGPTAGHPAAPDTGGTPIRITGSGFSQAIPPGPAGIGLEDPPIQFSDVSFFGETFASQYNYTLVNDGTITTQTVGVTPGVADVLVCSVTACSTPTSIGGVPGDDEIGLFPPGDPVVDSLSPAAEPADHLGPVTITGENLGCAISVTFGGRAAAAGFANAPGLLDCGSTTEIDTVVPPPLPAGTALPHTVAVLVTTLESTSTSGAVPTTHASFTYEAAAPAFTADNPPASAVEGHPYGPYTFRATGAPAPTFSVSSGALPPGLTLNRTTGVLSGKPTAPGTFRFQVTASNGASPAAVSPVRSITVAATTDTGYRTFTSKGAVFDFGSDQFFGSLGNVTLAKPIVGAATTSNNGGYWMVASDGGLFAFGNAGFHGSLGGVHLNKPIVAMAPTPDGAGYWMVASDGGIFAFGDAPFLGSLGSVHLNKPIVGMAVTQNGKGYWLVASDGGLFAFGNATFHGSLGSVHLVAPITAMAPTKNGAGYWMVANDGGIFAFGNAGFHGSLGGTHPPSAVVSIVPTPDGGGYAEVQTNGTVTPFGDFHSFGSAATASPVVSSSS